ncbi:potassium-transporting ATPase subunit KdpC [Kushneria aurantia]|uniref:Potassium-transporting ATPase KdpC subunit n=1 Tax=Kushneria aurantia TaxID=504092 RepID=A0ABV6G9B2_9GAMM|nr:potassium-transporting ATPase subunit KdpC [Kushneria aurantia]
MSLHTFRRHCRSGWLTTLRLTLVMALLLGLAYPLVVVTLGQLWFPHQANGSLLADSKGRVVGSALVGQAFTSDRYFQGRPSAVDYAADQLGGSNLAPSNPALRQRVLSDARRITARDGVAVGEIPVDLLTASGSGIDPDISMAGAELQMARIARVRGMAVKDVQALVARYGRRDGNINVLRLNLALDGIDIQPQ